MSLPTRHGIDHDLAVGVRGTIAPRWLDNHVRHPWHATAAVLALIALAAVISSKSTPSGASGVGLWPVGLVTGFALRAPTVPSRVAFGTATAAIAVLTLWWHERPWGISVGYGLSLTLAAAAAVLMIGSHTSLLTDRHLRRYLLACSGSALLAAMGVAITLEVAARTAGRTDVDSGPIALCVGISVLASHLVLVPAFLRLPTHVSLAPVVERSLQLIVISVVTLVIFIGGQQPWLVFLVIPLLAWGAARLSSAESLAQLITVLVLATLLTSIDRGPFADLSQVYGISANTRATVLAAFVASAAIIVVPIVLRVGEFADMAQTAGAERDLVAGIIDSASGTAIVCSDEAGIITLFNPGAELLLGYTAEEIVGRSAATLYTRSALSDKARELDVDDDVASVMQALVAGAHRGTLMAVCRKDGIERIHALTVTRLAGGGPSHPQATGYLSTSEDVSALVGAQRALEDALETERQAAERLRKVDAVKDAFVSTVSHELRTPITSMLGYLEMLTDGSFGELQDAQRRAISRISANSGRLLVLVNDLLTLSQVNEDGIAMLSAELDLGQAVTAAHDSAHVSAQQGRTHPRQLDVSLVLPERPLMIMGDRDMLERLASNLIGNAVKFTANGGMVTIHLSTEGNDAVLRIGDTGIGIPPDEIHLLFTRFFRSRLAHEAAIPGSGLGLVISKTIVDQHAGSVTVLSEVGTGTVVTVRLPLPTGALHPAARL